jgi:Fe2+ or Zn2+ uptake regulation protein
MAECVAVDLLKAGKVKITERREKILSLILASKSPLSAKDLHERANSESNIDLVTVYRVVSLLKEKGLVREILGDSGTAFYEKACVHNPVHPHFHCEKCGRVFCLEPLSFEEGLILGRVGRGCVIRSVSLDVKGVCEKCAALS